MRKLIAGFMTALIALLTTTSPVLAAEQLGSYPTFLKAADGTLGAYVVVGSTASVEDVVGAIDLATRLAEVGKGTTTTSCAGASAAVDGVSKDTLPIPIGHVNEVFPGAVRSFHYSKLKTGTYSWASNTYDYYEDIQLGTDQIFTSHDFQTTGINGTQSLVIPTNVLKYRYVFKKALNLSSKNGLGTVAAPEYTYPININLLGKSFQIVGLGTDQVVMLSGSIGTATATTPVVYGDYSAYSDLGNDAGWARVILKDKSGNTVDTLVITQGSDKTSTAAGLTIKVTAVRALQDGTIVGADLVMGLTNAIEKTYTANCDITGTGTSDFKFPGETEWCIQATGITSGIGGTGIGIDDTIEVVYKPSTIKHIKSTDADPALPLPNGYGKFGFVGTGFNYDSWTTLTFTPVVGKSAYWDDGMTGATNSTQAAHDLNGIEISSDVAGSIVNGSGTSTNGYTKAYILFNYTLTNGDKPVMVGFWDSVNSRIAVDPSDSLYYKVLNVSASHVSLAYNFTISYSNGAATADKQYLYINVTNPDNSTTVNGVSASGASFFAEFKLGTVAYPTAVLMNFENKTANSTWTTSTAPEFRLLSTSSAQATDVQAYSTSTAGTSTKVDVGLATQNVVTDAGSIIVSPNTYSGSDKVVVKVPAQSLFAKLYLGTLTSGTTGSSVSYTSYPSIPITSAVAKLDTEITATEKAKNLVAVGGPCVNKVTAAALGVTFPACGASSTIPESKGLIKVVASPYTEGTGKVVLVAAGWEAANTRAATSALQLYDTKLTGVTASSVEVTGTVGAPTVTPV